MEWFWHRFRFSNTSTITTIMILLSILAIGLMFGTAGAMTTHILDSDRDFDFTVEGDMVSFMPEPRVSITRTIAMGLLGIDNADTLDYCADKVTHRYDRTFRMAALKYLPVKFQRDWCALKAMCHHESLSNSSAVSNAGAMGYCQIMPATWTEWEQRLSSDVRFNRMEPYVAAYNIMVAANEMRRNYDVWYVDRNYDCHQGMAWACFNAGRGTVINSQSEAARNHGKSLCFDDIAEYLPRETQGYVPKIREVIEQWRL